jgi:hypothetical protein
MFKIEIPRKYISQKGQGNNVKMYFDVKIAIGESSARINGFRLVEQDGKNFVGFPSVAGKDGKRYPSFIPSRDMTDAIQVRAEQEYALADRTGARITTGGCDLR